MAFDKYGRFLYTRNPKTAGTSIFKGAMKGNQDFEQSIEDNADVFQGRGEKVLEAFLKNETEETFKFTFVRNPWDRIVSLWKYSAYSGWTTPDLPFSVFLSRVEDGRTNKNLCLHAEPQSISFLCDGKQYVDFIGRFENLQDDWRYVAEKVGLPSDLPVMRKTEHDHYREYHNSETEEVVYNLYKEVIDYLGYEP